jgi:hypothetical protein
MTAYFNDYIIGWLVSWLVSHAGPSHLHDMQLTHIQDKCICWYHQLGTVYTVKWTVYAKAKVD